MDYASYAPSAQEAMSCALKDIAGPEFNVGTPEGLVRAREWFKAVSTSEDGHSLLERLASSLAYHTERLENWPSIEAFSGSVRTATSSVEIPQEVWDDVPTHGMTERPDFFYFSGAADRERAYAECLRSMALVFDTKRPRVSPANLGFSDSVFVSSGEHASHSANFRVFLGRAADYLKRPRSSMRTLAWPWRSGALTTICPYQNNAGYLVVAKEKSRGRIQYFYDDHVVLVNVYYGDKNTLHEAAKLDEAQQFSESLVIALGGETDLALAAVESLKTSLDDPLSLHAAE